MIQCYGVEAMILQVRVSNQAALHLYEKTLGYTSGPPPSPAASSKRSRGITLTVKTHTSCATNCTRKTSSTLEFPHR